jgi:hypothetical protein
MLLCVLKNIKVKEISHYKNKKTQKSLIFQASRGSQTPLGRVFQVAG